ncbi:MAG: mercuric reductase [Thermoanaerobaculia bacterium]|nr:mercuric reductase [Thermoanaerobaculia bacterium]
MPDAEGLVAPLDTHNRELIANVHPVEWVNPEPADRYHLLVLGGGTGGLVSAAGAALLGARVALVEERLLGGDCLVSGCVPSKALIRAAEAWHEAATAAERFGGPRVTGPGDFGAVMERMRRLRAEISHHDSAARFRDLGVDVFLGRGRFVASDAIEVGGERLRFSRAVVATGARPLVPPIEGLEEAGYLTNETLFELTELPRRLGVVGGGPIGCEMGQSFARFGSRVTLIDQEPRLLPREEAEAAAIVQRALERDGVAMALGAAVRRVESMASGKRVHLEGRTEPIEVDELLLAVGRSPNSRGLGLSAAGVEHGRGGIEVDDRLRTSNRRVFAVGDVASRYQFTHMADALARIALRNALFLGRARASDLVVPWCTYTRPEVAHVGLSEAEAREAGHAVRTLRVPLATVDRAVLAGEAEGFLSLVVGQRGGRVLGATLVADQAGEMLGELCLAVTRRVGLDRIADVIHPYPTRVEVVRKAADEWRRGKLTPLVSRLLRLWLRLTA